MVQAPRKPQLRPDPYPDSDGKPMADNTEQFDWITLIVGNLRRLLKDQNAFVAGDLLWYPVQVTTDEPAPRQAPDALVALGRPPGRRGSYRQWEEEGIAPQVVFEVLSPSNTTREMMQKQKFYEDHGVLESYYYDPQRKDFWGYVRETSAEAVTLIVPLDLPWTSPLLGIRFELPDELVIFHPNGEPFAELTEVTQERDQARAERDEARAQLNQTEAQLNQTEAELGQTETERDRAFAKLRELGINPEDLP
ncbi:MAG: Uma2 family endonuclease [Spirulinaceae cyanobacterium]